MANILKVVHLWTRRVNPHIDKLLHLLSASYLLWPVRVALCPVAATEGVSWLWSLSLPRRKGCCTHQRQGLPRQQTLLLFTDRDHPPPRVSLNVWVLRLKVSFLRIWHDYPAPLPGHQCSLRSTELNGCWKPLLFPSRTRGRQLWSVFTRRAWCTC